MSATNRKRAQTAPVTDEEIARSEKIAKFQALNTQLRNAYLEQLYFAIRDDLQRELYADDSYSFWKSANKRGLLKCLALLAEAKPKSDKSYLGELVSLKAVFTSIADVMSANTNFCLSVDGVMPAVEGFLGDVETAVRCQDADALKKKVKSFASTALTSFGTVPALQQRFSVLHLALSSGEASLPDQLTAVVPSASHDIQGANTRAISNRLYGQLATQDAAPEPQSVGIKAPADLWESIGASIKLMVDTNPFQPISVSFLGWLFGVGEVNKGKLIKSVVTAVENKDHGALEKAVGKFQAYWLTKKNLPENMAIILKNLSNQAALLSSDKVSTIRAGFQKNIPDLLKVVADTSAKPEVENVLGRSLVRTPSSDSSSSVDSQSGQNSSALPKVFSSQNCVGQPPGSATILPSNGSQSEAVVYCRGYSVDRLSANRHGSFPDRSDKSKVGSSDKSVASL